MHAEVEARGSNLSARTSAHYPDRPGPYSPAPSTSQEPDSPTLESRHWQSRYTRLLWISDLIVLVWVVFGTQIFWFGIGNAALSLAVDGRFNAVSYWFASGLIVALWWWTLSLADSRSYRVIGTGWSEYIRVVDSSIRLFGVIAIVAFLFQIDIARGYLLVSLPVGVLMLVLVRWLWRQWLFAKRYSGGWAM